MDPHTIFISANLASLLTLFRFLFLPKLVLCFLSSLLASSNFCFSYCISSLRFTSFCFSSCISSFRFIRVTWSGLKALNAAMDSVSSRRAAVASSVCLLFTTRSSLLRGWTNFVLLLVSSISISSLRVTGFEAAWYPNRVQ